MLGRKNGIPWNVTFHSNENMISFITLLDGYYRLMVKQMFNLCREYETPSLLKLRRLKCHGPVGYFLENTFIKSHVLKKNQWEIIICSIL